MTENMKRQTPDSMQGGSRVTPEFRKEPDIEKLVRALILIAEKMADGERTGGCGKEAA